MSHLSLSQTKRLKETECAASKLCVLNHKRISFLYHLEITTAVIVWYGGPICIAVHRYSVVSFTIARFLRQ